MRAADSILEAELDKVAQEGIDDGWLDPQLPQEGRCSPPEIMAMPAGCSACLVDTGLRPVPVAQSAAA